VSLSLPVSGPLALTGAALSDRLKLVFPPERFTHGFMPAKIDQAAWKQITRRMPFVGLGWTEVAAREDAGRLFDGTSHWTVFLVTRNSAGIAQRYFGDALGPGLFQMVQAAIGVLHGWTIEGSPDGDKGRIGTVAVTRAGNLFAEGIDLDDSAIAGLDLVAKFTLPVPAAVHGDEPDILKTLGIDWQFNGGDFPDVFTTEAA
jgi:hypothetical protein